MPKWTRDQDVVAFYLQKYDPKCRRSRSTRLGPTTDEVAARIHKTTDAVLMRIQNFVAVEAAGGRWLSKAERGGLPGLANYARQSAEVYCEFNCISEGALKARAIKVISGA